MVKSVEELKEFITWCRSNGVLQVTMDGISFTATPAPLPVSTKTQEKPKARSIIDELSTYGHG